MKNVTIERTVVETVTFLVPHVQDARNLAGRGDGKVISRTIVDVRVDAVVDAPA